MTTCAEYAALLAAAEAALNKLMTGSKVEILRDGEKSINYTPANLSALERYIEQLRARVDACNGVRSAKKRLIQFIPE